VTETHLLTGREPHFLAGEVVHERAVGGTAIAQMDAVIREHQLGVARGNADVRQVNLAMAAAADVVHAHAEFHRLLAKPRSLDDKPRHEFLMGAASGRDRPDCRAGKYSAQRIFREGEVAHDFPADQMFLDDAL
jgi:hypothetical protein